MNTVIAKVSASVLLAVLFSLNLSAQNVGISNSAITPDGDAILELRTTTKGVLLPRMTTAQRGTLVTDVGTFTGDANLGAGLGPADEGMTIYNSTTNKYNFWDGGSWVEMAVTTAVISSTLDDAYDAGGAGLGRAISVDAGAVTLNGSGGTIALETDGDIQLTTDDAWIGSSPILQRLRFDDNSSGRIHVEVADLTMDTDRWVGIDGSSPRIEFEDGGSTDSERINVQNAHIELDDDRWIGLNASNPRIEFDNTNDRLDMRSADIELDAGKWVGIGNTVERLIFDGTDDEVNIMGATGGVGIGTEDPDAHFEVYGNGGGSPFVAKIVKSSNTPSELVGIGLGSEDFTHIVKSGIVHERINANGAGKLHFLVDNATDANDVTIAESRMTINQTGKVGIGETDPQEELHVDGDIRSTTLAGGGNVQADANGNLIISNDLPGTDGSYIQNQYSSAQATSEYWISGRGRMDGGLTVGAGATLDNNNTNVGTVANGALAFGNSSGEGIGSKRNTGGNQYGLDFYTNSVNRLAIENGGDVGIGTSEPNQKLDVRGIIRSEGNYRVDVDGNNGSGPRIAFGTTTNEYAYMNLGAYNSINNLETTTRNFRIGSDLHANALYLEASTGELGINTNSPEARLHIRTNSGSGGGHLRIQRESTDGEVGISMFPKHADGTNAWYMTVGGWANTDDWVLGGGGGSERIVVENSTGNVGIGTNAPSHKLHVAGNNSGIRIEGTGIFGSEGRFNFGDDNYVYIEETADDYLTIEANDGTRIGNQGTYTRDVFHGTFTVGDNNANACGACVWSGWGGNVLEIQVSWANLGIPDGTNKTVILMADGNNNTYTDIWNVALQTMFSNRMDILIDRTDGGGWGLTTLRIHYIVMNNN